MFNQKTNNGWDIISKFQNNKGTFVVVKRNNDYAWGSYYNEETGNWAQGHYDYTSPKQAEEDMIAFALGVNIIPQEDKGLNATLQSEAEYIASVDIQNGESEACFDVFMEMLLEDLRKEIHSAYDTYKDLVEA